MFVAQPSFPMTRAATSATVSRATPWLIAWAAIGGLILLLSDAARGGPLLGASLPFWLVGAPLIDLAWVERARIRTWLGDHVNRSGRRARLRRNAGASRLPPLPHKTKGAPLLWERRKARCLSHIETRSIAASAAPTH